MVDITPGIPEGRNMIDGYGDNGFRVNGERLEGSYVLGMTQKIAWAEPISIDEAAVLTLLKKLQAMDDPVELLLLGTGKNLVFLPESLRQKFRDAGIGVDLMDTGAACRTFNVLMTEGRYAAAALIAVE